MLPGDASLVTFSLANTYSRHNRDSWMGESTRGVIGLGAIWNKAI